MSDKNSELIWVRGQLHNLISEARHCGSEEAEKLLLMFAAITSIGIDHDPNS